MGVKPALLGDLLDLPVSEFGVMGRKSLDGDTGLLPPLLADLLKFRGGEFGRVPAALPGRIGRRDPGGNGAGLKTLGGRALSRLVEIEYVGSKAGLSCGDGPALGVRRFGEDAEGCRVEVDS